MKRFIPYIIVVVLLAVIGGVVFAFFRVKQNRDAEMNDFYLCETQYNDQKYGEAVKLLEAFIEDYPKSKKAVDVYYYLARSQEGLAKSKGNPGKSDEDLSKEALKTWYSIIENYPESPYAAEAHYKLAIAQEEMGKLDEAMQNYKAAVEKASDSVITAGARYRMGTIDEARDQLKDAIEAYQEVFQNYPDTEFAIDAERKFGNIRLTQFLKERTISYEVRRGDVLESIARKFRITPELIKKLNNFSSSTIQTGDMIKVVEPDFNIVVDLSRFNLILRSGESVVRIYNVAIGKPDTPTHLGNFKVTDKSVDPVWYSTLPSGRKEVIPSGDPRNELGTRWIGFEPAYGIHGTIAPDSIGKALSKGCVRMHNKDVEELYDLVAKGTPVKIVAGEQEGKRENEKVGK